MDLGLVYTLRVDPQTLTEEYRFFFGTSPLSTPPSSPPLSVSSDLLHILSYLTNLDLELEYDAGFGTSPLPTPPSSLDSVHSPLPVSPAMVELDQLPVSPKVNSEAHRNRQKGHANRRRKRERYKTRTHQHIRILPSTLLLHKSRRPPTT